MGESPWSTSNEKQYLDGAVIGKWLIRPRVVSREQLLKNYIRSAERRQEWGTFGSVNAKEMLRYARQLLAKIKGEEL